LVEVPGLAVLLRAATEGTEELRGVSTVVPTRNPDSPEADRVVEPEAWEAWVAAILFHLAVMPGQPTTDNPDSPVQMEPMALPALMAFQVLPMGFSYPVTDKMVNPDSLEAAEAAVEGAAARGGSRTSTYGL
jgi:hypothetical protein